nr:chromate transporter [Ralstonia solanacearum]
MATAVADRRVFRQGRRVRVRFGLAIVPFLYGGVVTEYHWLNEKQFVDAVAVAMITRARWSSRSASSVIWWRAYRRVRGGAGTFLPCYLFTILRHRISRSTQAAGDPGVRRRRDGGRGGRHHRGGDRAGQALDCRCADALLALATVALLLKFKKLSEPVIVAGAALIGLAVYPLLHH